MLCLCQRYAVFVPAVCCIYASCMLYLCQLENEKNLLAAKWDEQNAQLVDGHERLVQELTDDYEYKLQACPLAMCLFGMVRRGSSPQYHVPFRLQEERAHVESLKLEKEQLIQKIEAMPRVHAACAVARRVHGVRRMPHVMVYAACHMLRCIPRGMAYVLCYRTHAG